jgi:multisubunit Na+/H+ antiporter MnhB subunit
MTTANNVQEEVNQQASIGFSKEEIQQNLLAKGYTETEIKEVLANVKLEENNEGSVSTKHVLLGILFLVIVLFRIGRFTNGGGFFAGMGIVTGIGMMIYFFTKRK